MAPSSKDKEELLQAAYELFKKSDDGFSQKDALKKLESEVPGFTQRQYKAAWTRVTTLFDNACKLVFRWSADKPPGTVFELPDENRVFVDELNKLCRGFSDEQYLEALEYGFEKAIF